MYRSKRDVDLSHSGVRRYCFMRLSMKNYSSYELRRLLKQKGVSSTIIEQTLEELTQQGYLNDQEWIESFIQGQLARHKGPKFIQAQLQFKGIPKETIENAFKTIDLRENQERHIEILLKSRYRSKDLTNPKERQKVVASLVRKGFDLTSIFKVMDYTMRVSIQAEYSD